ncbi:Protein unc-80 like [Quillaja saponaria]|uniref:Protein unc-80 like n=1 Tax=Quillaja saponaria TaxID=32244 RepID=A0AAD7VMC3_QUISA|nr:Protein unc-80 like [Quillaja saponaria]
MTARVPIRPTYVNLYKWPESDAEFVKMVSSNTSKGLHSLARPQVVDSISCRQMYLRSYKFSRRKEGVTEKTMKCLGRVKQIKKSLLLRKASRYLVLPIYQSFAACYLALPRSTCLINMEISS